MASKRIPLRVLHGGNAKKKGRFCIPTKNRAVLSKPRVPSVAVDRTISAEASGIRTKSDTVEEKTANLNSAANDRFVRIAPKPVLVNNPVAVPSEISIANPNDAVPSEIINASSSGAIPSGAIPSESINAVPIEINNANPSEAVPSESINANSSDAVRSKSINAVPSEIINAVPSEIINEVSSESINVVPNDAVSNKVNSNKNGLGAGERTSVLCGNKGRLIENRKKTGKGSGRKKKRNVVVEEVVALDLKSTMDGIDALAVLRQMEGKKIVHRKQGERKIVMENGEGRTMRHLALGTVLGEDSREETIVEKVDSDDVMEKSNSNDNIAAPTVEIVDGRIVMNAASLEIEQTSIMEMDNIGTSRKGRKRGPSAHWTQDELCHFYMCLRQVGTDFSLMETLFPTRTRRELKLRFKREDKTHPSLVELSLNAKLHIDAPSMKSMLASIDAK